jgi:hypothetical protein
VQVTSTTTSRVIAIATIALLTAVAATACGSSHSTGQLAAATHAVCLTPSDRHVLVVKRPDGTLEAPVPDRRTSQPLACEQARAPASAKSVSAKAARFVPTKVGSAPDTASCLPTATDDRPDESVCLFWYNASTLNLSMYSAHCEDGHISPGTYGLSRSPPSGSPPATAADSNPPAPQAATANSSSIARWTASITPTRDFSFVAL